MERRVGTSELLVSAVGLGCNNFSREGTATATVAGTRAVLDAAIDNGVTFLDTAELYGNGGSEDFMGQALEGRRDKVVIATKFGHERGGPQGSQEWGPRGAERYIRSAVEGSLTRLRTDRIDLLQMHTPDPSTPIGDTLQALSRLVQEGKVAFVGHSNFTAEQIEEAERVSAELGTVRFISAQNHYSLLERGVEADVLPAVEKAELGFLPYFPLANGLLTGKYTRDHTPAGRLAARPEVLAETNWEQLEAYQRLCDEAGVSMLGATFAWLLSRPTLASVIAGATTPEQVAANAEAGRTTLGDDTLNAISDLFS